MRRKIKRWLKSKNKFANFLQRINIFFCDIILSDKVNKTCLGGGMKFKVPTIMKGKGKFIFNGNSIFGSETSPHFYEYNYIEARNPETVIEFGYNIVVNNKLSIVAEGLGDNGGVYIGKDTMIGFNVTMMDSDFHDIDPKKRRGCNTNIKTGKIVIGNNCWIGSNVTILKGVTLGDNSIVAACSVVTKSFPENVIIAGNPAKIIKENIEVKNENLDSSIC